MLAEEADELLDDKEEHDEFSDLQSPESKKER